MELKEFVALYRRWFWLLIAGLGFGLVCGFVISMVQTPLYEASTKVLVARNRQQGSADILSLTDQQLVATYQQLLKTQPITDEVASRLGIKIDPDNVRAVILPNTQIIQITVRDGNAGQAVTIANSLVQILIDRNETLQAGRYAAYGDGLDVQIAQVQKQIADLQNQITEIDQANIKDQLAQVDQQIAASCASSSTKCWTLSQSRQAPGRKSLSGRTFRSSKPARARPSSSLRTEILWDGE